MAFDSKSNFGFGLVAIAPSPATTGTTFSMTNAEAALMPDPSTSNYNLTIWQNNKRPILSNTEIVRVTARGAANSGGTGFTQFTITRQQEGTSARSIVSGDFVGNNITKKSFDDIENVVAQKTKITVGTSAGADYVCTGTADDTKIQAAINAVGVVGGGTVLLKKGTYNLTTRLNLDFDNVWLVGEEYGTVIIQDTHSTGLDFLIRSSVSVTTSYRRNIGITNLILDGQSKSDVGFTSHNALGLTVQSCKIGNIKTTGNWALNITSIDPNKNSSPTTAALAQNVLVDDCEFYLAGASQDLVAFGHGRDATFRNCVFRDGRTGASGLLSISDGTRENVVVDSCTFYESTNVSNAAIYTSITGVSTKVINCEVRGMANALILGGNNTVVSNNTFFGGISCRADTLPNYAKITGNTVNTIGKAVSGITLQGDDHSVSSNVVTSDNAGIYLNSSCDRCVIDSNNVINPNLSGSQNSGIEVRGTGNIVTGNRISDTRGTRFMYRGIYVSSSTDNHIYDNSISGATQYGIAEAGTSDFNEYGDNTFRNNSANMLLVGTNNIINNDNNFNVKVFGAVGNGVSDDSAAINIAISACSAVSGGTVFIPRGTYYIGSSITMLSNIKLLGDGRASTILISDMATSNNRGIVNINNKNNMVIEGITFSPSVSCNGITSYGHDGLIIRNCGFTGASSTNNAGAGGMVALTCQQGLGSTVGCFNTLIEQNKFYDITTLDARTIYTSARNGLNIEHLRVLNNKFTNNGGPCIALNGTGPAQPTTTAIPVGSAVAYVKDILIEGNYANNVREGTIGGTQTACLVQAGVTWQNVIFGLKVHANYYENNNTSILRGNLIEFYGCYDTVISNNHCQGAYIPGGASIQGSCISPGRVSNPDIGVVIKDNYIKGFNSTWDPDSMIDMEASGNIIVSCGDGLSPGYEIKHNINIHDNIFHNSPSKNDGSAINFGNYKYSKVQIRNNLFVDDRSVPAPTGVSATLVSGGSLAATTTYFYVVTAVDDVGETVASSQVSATTTSTNKTIKIQWVESVGAVGYKIYRTTTSGTYGATSFVTAFSYATSSTTGLENTFNDTGITLSTGQPPAVSTVATAAMTCPLRINSNGDYSDVVFTGNRFYAPNITLSNILVRGSGSEISPSTMFDNEIHDATGRRANYYNQGNVSGATTFNWENTLSTKSATILATLTNNITTTITNGKSAGDELTLILIQDGTGNWSWTVPSNLKVAGGTLTLSTAANSKNVIRGRWDGTNYIEQSRSLGII